MKRFLMITFSIGFVVILILACIECTIRHIPNEYSFKYDFLEKNVKDIKVLFVGSSVGRSGFNPSYISAPAFNAANVSQDIETDCAIVDKYIGRSDSLKTVVFALLPGSFASRMGDGIENWRLRKYHIYMDLDVEDPPLSERLEISSLNKTLTQIMKYYRGGVTVECDERGMGLDTIVVNEENKLSQAIFISELHNDGYNPSNYSITVPRVERTIENCQKRGVDVFMIMLPAYYTYSSRISSKMLSECDSIATMLEQRYSNVTYKNMFVDSTFTTEDFRNSNHLSQRGAVKLTKKIDQLLKDNGK